MSSPSPRRWARLSAIALTLLVGLAACGSSDAATETAGTGGQGATDSTAAKSDEAKATGLNTSPDQDRIVPAKVDDIAAKVPAEIRDRGTLEIGVGAAGAGFPPLAFAADDNTTLIGSEPDIAVLVAGVLGLKPDIQTSSWEDLFLGIDSGKYDVAFSNVTVTEERKEKYDFATYREDNLALEAPADADWTFTKPEDLAGKTIAVGSGTNQEKILVEFAEKVKGAGLDEITIKYFQDNQAQLLALQSGQIDARFGPYPSYAYNVSVGGKTKIVGTYSGAGKSLQGLIAAMTKKDNGLVEAVNLALEHVITSGDYETVLKRWNLADEAVADSQVNPPGLPKSAQ